MLILNEKKLGTRQTVCAYNFDGTLRRSWKAFLIDKNESMLTLFGTFENRVEHPFLGVIPAGTASFEFYPFDNWFNIFCFLTLDGKLRNYYCNLAAPPVIDESGLSFVDYEIDILITENAKVQILDLQDFVTMDENGQCDLRTKEKLSDNLLILLRKIELKEFPFDFETHLSPFIDKLFDVE